MLWEMPLKQVEADVISYSAAISSCEKYDVGEGLRVAAGDAFKADQMRKAKCGHQPCQKSQLWEESFASLQEMYSKLLTPDVVRLNSVTSSVVSAEEWACIQHWYSQHSPLKCGTA